MRNFKYILEAINRGIQLALDDYEDQQEDKPIAPQKDAIRMDDSIKKFVDFRDQFVDLGLPSGTRWYKYNLGVDYENLDKFGAWHGQFYAWGETEPRSKGLNFVWTTYKFSRGSYNMLKKYLNGNKDLAAKDPNKIYTGPGSSVKFYDELKKLLPEDDAAYQNLYIGEHHSYIPSKEECLELFVNTKLEFCNKYNNIPGLEGIKLISKINGNHIFFPFTGYDNNGNLYNINDAVYFWTSNLGRENHEYQSNAVEIAKGLTYSIHYFERANGLPVRPVIRF